MENTKNLLILGSNGFLGKNVFELVKHDKRFNIFDLKGKEDLDLTKDDLLDNYLKNKNIDYIINCAAFVGGIAYGYDYPAELIRKNTIMASNIYHSSYLNDIKLLINPISNCAYPEDQNLYLEENFWQGKPHDSVFEYGFSKKMLVALGNAYFKEYKLSSANIVLSNMYGPYDHFEEKKSHALGALIQKIHHAKNNGLDEIEVWGSGKPIREWLYVEDGAVALVKSMDLKGGHFFFNIGVNKGMSIIDLAKKIAKHFEWNGKFILNEKMPDGAEEKRVVGTFMEDKFNWSPQMNIDDGIKATIEWYEKNL
tara:strand:- start:247 stop:1176 length:930 start_codon:yes stop_codon:yes gene_type:complete